MAMVLSAAMMLRIGLKQGAAADALEAAVDKVLADGFRTGDLMAEGCTSWNVRPWVSNCCNHSEVVLVQSGPDLARAPGL